MKILKLIDTHGVIHDNIILNVEGSNYGCIYETPFLLKSLILSEIIGKICPECGGKGKLIFGSGEASVRICDKCHGTGQVPVE